MITIDAVAAAEGASVVQANMHSSEVPGARVAVGSRRWRWTTKGQSTKRWNGKHWTATEWGGAKGRGAKGRGAKRRGAKWGWRHTERIVLGYPTKFCKRIYAAKKSRKDRICICKRKSRMMMMVMVKAV